jgi:peptidoglycan/LPS O-acetylase OafA/YrhL
MLFWIQYGHFYHTAEAAFPLPWADIASNDPSRPEPTGANILTHITFLFGLFPQYASNDVLPDWSLSLEMQFYVAIPLILCGRGAQDSQRSQSFSWPFSF